MAVGVRPLRSSSRANGQPDNDTPRSCDGRAAPREEAVARSCHQAATALPPA